MSDTISKPSWARRFTIICLTLMFCALVIGYSVYQNLDTELARLAVICAFGLAGAVIGSYVFGATWDDKNVMAMTKGRL